MPSIEPAALTFVYGFLASSAVEVVTLYRLYLLDTDRLPGRYRKVGFWVVRVLVAVVAGGVAVAVTKKDIWAAVLVGAAAPLITEAIARVKPKVGVAEVD